MALSEISEWRKIFEMYRSQEGAYPPIANGGYCLGSGFPLGSDGLAGCRDYLLPAANRYLESNNTQLMNELKKVGSLPGGAKDPVNGLVGPYVAYSNNEIALVVVLRGTATSDCPSTMVFSWTDGLTKIQCKYVLYK